MSASFVTGPLATRLGHLGPLRTLSVSAVHERSRCFLGFAAAVSQAWRTLEPFQFLKHQDCLLSRQAPAQASLRH